MLEKRSFYIDGRWVAARSRALMRGRQSVRRNRVRGDSLGAKDDVDRAVAAARAAFSGWSETPPLARADLLEKLADIYDSRIDEMAAAISLEMGAADYMARKSQAAAARRICAKRFASPANSLSTRRFRGGIRLPHFARAHRRVRSHHALELADESSHAQSRPRARGRLRRGVKAVRNRAAVVAPFAEMVDAGGFPRGVSIS